MRSGAQTLTLLAAPLTPAILDSLREGHRQQVDLHREAGSPAQTTLRAQLKRLVALGVVDRQRHDRFPGTLTYELTDAGHDLLFVADALERWLEQAPDGSPTLGHRTAKAAIKALAEGWSTNMIRALAARPLSLTELDGVIGSVSYPSLERRLTAMRLAGLLEACPAESRGTPYQVTDWLREGVVPLAAAARWERLWAADTCVPIGRVDFESLFLLALPLLRPPAGLTGSCRMAAELSNGRAPRLAGVTAVASDGVVSCATPLNARSDAWALGSPGAWLDALIESDIDRLELGGDHRLARGLLEGLHRTLFLRHGVRRHP